VGRTSTACIKDWRVVPRTPAGSSGEETNAVALKPPSQQLHLPPVHIRASTHLRMKGRKASGARCCAGTTYHSPGHSARTTERIVLPPLISAAGRGWRAVVGRDNYHGLVGHTFDFKSPAHIAHTLIQAAEHASEGLARIRQLRIGSFVAVRDLIRSVHLVCQVMSVFASI
jgi:hypothetical protein